MTGSSNGPAISRVFWLIPPSVALVTSAGAAWVMVPMLGSGSPGHIRVGLMALMFFAGQLVVTLLTGFACVTLAPHLRPAPALAGFTLAAIWFGPAVILVKTGGVPSVVGYAIMALVVAKVLQDFRPRASEPTGFSGALGMALLLQSGTVALAAGARTVAIVLVGTGSFWLCWKWYRVRHTVPARGRAVVLVAASVIAVVICSLVLSHSQQILAAGTASGENMVKAREPNLHDGVVLRPEHVQRITWLAPLPQVSIRRSATSAEPRPFHIPFSGEYWFFHALLRRVPGGKLVATHERPPPTSLVETGDPTGWNFSGPALTMKAHQPLERAVDLACCERIDVALNDADESPGTFALELILSNSAVAGQTQSLGIERVIRENSESIARFTVPTPSELKRFDSIDVTFHLKIPRREKSANVAIKEFELIPAGR